MKETEVTIPIRRRAGPTIRVTKVVVTYRDGRGTLRKRTIDLPAGARDVKGVVFHLLEGSVEFDIPLQAVEAGLAEWFQRTEGELLSFVGGRR